jgi:hypothetical protein
MGSIEGPAMAGVKLPIIKLDTTIAELYKRANPNKANTRVGWVSCGVTSGVNLTDDFPRNAKFVYQDQAIITTPRQKLSHGTAELQRSHTKKYLGLISQRDAFISGDTPVIFFNLGQTPEQIEHDRREAEATISVLDPSQRLELVFCPGPAKIPVKQHGIDQLQYKIALDDLASYPLTHDLEAHWFLNSKAALARSGLPTPRADIIEVESYPVAADSCCAVCQNNSSDLPFIPPSCTGPRGKWLASQTARILSAIHARPVPFVLKTQQAFGGAGTWLVQTEQKKASLLADLSGSNSNSKETESEDEKEEDGILRKLLSLPTPRNTHLHPATLLLTDLIASPTADYGLTFMVTASGDAIFLAAAEQMISSNGGDGAATNSAWVGSVIYYARQEELRERFAGFMGRIAEWVGGHGYVGPVGADVLQDGDGDDGSWYVVDLNVRTCGSVSLPLLRGHFVGRGLWCASSFSMTVRGGREGFVVRWRGAFEEGRMLILSWYE